MSPPVSHRPPFRYGRPAFFASGPVYGPMKSSITNVVLGPRQAWTSSVKIPIPSVTKWNIRLRPTWPERLASPCGWAAERDSRRSRAVSMPEAARITMSARALRFLPRESR